MPAPPKPKKLLKATAGRSITVEDVIARMKEDGVDEEAAADRETVDDVMGLMFRGKKCTKNCEGHRRGYEWKMAGRSGSKPKSASFGEGFNS